jgi:ribA/ribD-fused uncharacterized protein
MYPLSSDGLNKETDQAIYFFTPAFHPFDSFSAHQVKIWGIKFPTAEHAFQWKKFSKTSPETSKKILEAPSPEAAKRISEAHKQDMPKDWHQEKTAIMELIFRAKAEQNEDVREVLQRSGKRQIIENSPVDSFWGIGPNGDGQNMVGKVWMKVRDNLLDN